METRRDLLKFGGLGLMAASADAVWPLKVAASGASVKPRSNARNVLFYEFSGAISHVEGFDFKETAGTPKDLDVRKIKDDLYLSKLLFPKFEKHIDKFAILRSMLSHEEVHFRAQYYQQTGRQLNLAFAREIRLPYLDYRLVNMVLPLAPRWKMRAGCRPATTSGPSCTQRCRRATCAAARRSCTRFRES